MIGYVSVQEQADKDFHRALLKASWHRWKDRLGRNVAHKQLLPFEEAKAALVHWSQAYRGMMTVEVEKISGSDGGATAVAGRLESATAAPRKTILLSPLR